MKYFWEKQDIRAGRIVCKNIGPRATTSNFASVTYKIGFCASRNEDRYCLIAMTDGMICNFQTKDKLAHYLSTENFMPCPHDKLIETINYLRE